VEQNQGITEFNFLFYVSWLEKERSQLAKWIKNVFLERERGREGKRRRKIRHAGIEQLDTESWKMNQHAVYGGGLGFGFRCPSSPLSHPPTLFVLHHVQLSIAIVFVGSHIKSTVVL
jgi:hypothetical protein